MDPLLLISLLISLTTFHCLATRSGISSISDGLDTFSVTEYGAIGDGKHYDTASIQAAIDACHNSGGRRVLLPSSRDYLTATIFLKSSVTPVVEKGARLLGGTKEEDYLNIFDRWYVVLAENATRVGITGGGEINGQGEAFVAVQNKRKNVMVSWNATGMCLGDECRPRLIGFVDDGCQGLGYQA